MSKELFSSATLMKLCKWCNQVFLRSPKFTVSHLCIFLRFFFCFKSKLAFFNPYGRNEWRKNTSGTNLYSTVIGYLFIFIPMEAKNLLFLCPVLFSIHSDSPYRIVFRTVVITSAYNKSNSVTFYAVNLQWWNYKQEIHILRHEMNN